MWLSRREFLKLTGVALAGTALDWPYSISQQGRILQPVIVQPTGEKLLPDTVYPIQGVHNQWVRLPVGYIPKTAIQPMLVPHQQPFTTLPAWGQVITPYAAIRAYADSRARLLQRPGHGAIFHIRRLLDGWLEVELAEQTGWVQRSQMQPALWASPAPQISGEIAGTHLMLYQAEKLVLQAPLVRPLDLIPGRYRLTRKLPADQRGTPFQMWLENGVRLQGVIDHHDFDRTADQPQVELPLLAAHMMFSLFSVDSYLTTR